MKRLGIGEQCANDLLDRTTGGSRTRAQKTDDSNAHERSLATFRRKYAAFRGSRDRGQTTGSSPCSGAEPIAADRAGVTDVGLDFLPSGEYLNQDAE